MSENIFDQYFKDRSKNLTKEQEHHIIKLLKGRISKWFVPYYLYRVDYFSTNLMKALIETGIKVIDPSYNNCFLIPAQKVHKTSVSDYLIERFQKSTLNVKRGIFRLFYWDKTSGKQYEDRISMLLDEFDKTRNLRLRAYISRNLPNEIEDYPESLKAKALEYVTNNKRVIS